MSRVGGGRVTGARRAWHVCPPAVIGTRPPPALSMNANLKQSKKKGAKGNECQQEEKSQPAKKIQEPERTYIYSKIN